jgi:hypothetical protein
MIALHRINLLILRSWEKCGRGIGASSVNNRLALVSPSAVITNRRDEAGRALLCLCIGLSWCSSRYDIHGSIEILIGDHFII